METNTSKIDQGIREEAIEKLLGIARTAEAIALRSCRKVRTMFLIGILSAGWLTYYFTHVFALSLPSTLTILLFLVLPSLLLGKVYLTLQEIIGLPERLLVIIDKIKGKTAEYRQMAGANARMPLNPPNLKAKFSDLWRLGKSLLEVKSLSDEANELASVFGGALILANPIFAVVMAMAGAITVLLAFVAFITGIAHVL